MRDKQFSQTGRTPGIGAEQERHTGGYIKSTSGRITL
jgi:hypothetical protein